jgi:hypothetical protein
LTCQSISSSVESPTDFEYRGRPVAYVVGKGLRERFDPPVWWVGEVIRVEEVHQLFAIRKIVAGVDVHSLNKCRCQGKAGSFSHEYICTRHEPGLYVDRLGGLCP